MYFCSTAWKEFVSGLRYAGESFALVLYLGVEARKAQRGAAGVDHAARQDQLPYGIGNVLQDENVHEHGRRDAESDKVG